MPKPTQHLQINIAIMGGSAPVQAARIQRQLHMGINKAIAHQVLLARLQKGARGGGGGRSARSQSDPRSMKLQPSMLLICNVVLSSMHQHGTESFKQAQRTVHPLTSWSLTSKCDCMHPGRAPSPDP